jgi:ornithine--oxo-acid transaminase
MGKIFRARLSALNLPYITTVRGKGLLNAVIVDEKHHVSAWEMCVRLKVYNTWLIPSRSFI